MEQKKQTPEAKPTGSSLPSAPSASPRGTPSPGGRADAATSNAPQAGASTLLPAISAPKGGGAIRGIGEKVSVNAATGTASMQIPIALTPGRGGSGPQLSLTYSSGAGSSAFGIGFALSVPSVTRKTDKGLPRYYDEEESDEYILSGAEDLVALRDETGALVELTRVLAGVEYRVRRYRPRVEGLFALIERYIAPNGEAHFRVTTKDNVTHIYGSSATSRVADPANPTRVFTWLLDETHDDKGNVVRYDYKAEDGAGVSSERRSEASRFEAGVFVATAQRYIKRALYSNKVPFVGATPDDFLMEVVFDYGEHSPSDVTAASVPTPAEDQPWVLRPDPFSSFRSGFDVRTYRLCRRVLMFHRFTSVPLLVKSTDFTYEAGPSITYLIGVTQRGYLNDVSTGNSWRTDSLPPLNLDYTRAVLHDMLSALPRESYEGLEGGVDGARKQWVDLDGEGIPGVLINSGTTWHYKANDGSGTLKPPRQLSSMPNPALLGGLQQLEDLAGDGRLDLVSYQNPLPGYFTRSEDGSFEPFRAFDSVPNIDFKDPNLRTIDLDGDGLPDLLITEERAFTWYRSRGKAGFEPLERWTVPRDEDKAPAVVFADPEQTIQLADMSGDGLVDIVRIRNSEVCYWPNLGFGRFGAKIILEGCPYFAPPGEFDARRVRFGDVDGSGTSDLFYVGAKETTLYRNQAGNSFAPGERIHALPPVDNLTSLSIVDLLGQGTSTLVWSSPLPGPRPIFYVDLMGGVKPHLLNKIVNNLGAETRLTFAPSTKFYLEDKKRPETRWLTRLTFPVHVVEKVELFDRISQSRLLTTYRYRHGYFDGEEREFRGFARVEQRDAEAFSVGPATELYQAPVRTVTWFHTGAWLEKERLESALSKEYFQGGPRALLVADTVFERDSLATHVTVQERREAARALRGSMLRQEVYADDGSPLADKPYVVTEQNFSVRRLQAALNGKHAVFFVHARESLAVHTERHADDPRIGHELTLRVDDFGNVTRLVKIAYARQPVAARRPEQSKTLATLTLSAFVNHPGALDPDHAAPDTHWHRLGLGFDASTYELTGLPAPADLAGVLDFDTVDELVENLLSSLSPANDLPFEDTSSPTTALRRRVLDRKQQLFYDASLSAALPLGQVTSLALPYESYTLALTPGIVSQIAADSLALSGTAFDSALLVSEGGYTSREGGYWVPSGRLLFDPTRFYLPVEAVDPFANHAFVTWDAFSLLVTSTRDPLNNVTSAENDYRVLAPRLVTDPNLNRIESGFDALGMLVRTAVMGKAGEAKGDTIQTPTSELQYDLFRWMNEGEPARVHAILREQHASDNPASRLQHSYAYSDGFGRLVMQKVQAEPGEVPGMQGVINPRWVGTGRTIFNNKGNPVKQYEPFFSATSDYESEDSVVQFGVTPIIHYDPVGRVIRTDYPDGTFSKVVFDAWREENWDQNDTVLESSWYQDRGAPSPTASEPTDPVTRSAWLAAQHAGTPTVTHLDTLGRVFSSIATNRTNGVDAEYQTKTQLDIEGNTLAIFDARQIDLNPGSPLATITQRFDVLQRRFKLVSADAGTRLAVADVAGKPLRSWDSRGQTLRSRYDALQRATHVYMRKAATERLLVRTVYGEALDPTLAQQNNLRGKAYQVYDSAGLVTSNAHDFKGNILSASRRLAVAYATEPDWIAAQTLSEPSAILSAVASLLQTEVFTTTSTYDALNRVTRSTAPDGSGGGAASATRFVYNEASLLDSIHVAVRGAAESPVVTNIDYNVRGLRTRCDYQNGSVTTYQYDPKTFRVSQIRTLRASDAKLLQLLDYTYDAVGNITDVRDGSNWDTTLNNLAASGVTGHGRYTYDALYRLVSATGREHPALQTDDADPPRYALPHGNDLQQLRTYVEKISYDQVGNILEMRHLTGPSNSQSWSRRYQYAANNNRLLATSAAGDPNGTFSLSYGYTSSGSNDAGAHGSMTSMPHLASLEWDYADRLKHTLKSSGSAQNTYFTYDASGERVRKVYLHDGIVEERIYLGAYEVYRRRSGTVTAAVQLERQTLHLMDGTRRVLIIETKTTDTINGDPAPLNTPRRRYQLDNHLGSSALELNDTAQAISYEEYHPYGSTAFHSASSAVVQKRYRYTGKEKDDETGLYYHGARYYAPWLGRWTAADPLGLVDGPNLYRYSRSNPVVFRDPGGRQSEAQAYGDRSIRLSLRYEANTGRVSYDLNIELQDRASGDRYAYSSSGGTGGLRELHQQLEQSRGFVESLSGEEREGLFSELERFNENVSRAEVGEGPYAMGETPDSATESRPGEGLPRASGNAAKGLEADRALPQRYRLEPPRGATETGVRDTHAGRVRGNPPRPVGAPVVRLDQPHGSTNYPHVNIETLNPDPHYRISPEALRAVRGTARILEGAARVARPVAIVTDAIRLGAALREDEGIGTNTARTAASVAGGWVGAFAGAWAGAKGGALVGGAIGSLVPGLGTAAGAAVGGLIGGLAGGIGGAFLFSWAAESAVDKALE